MTSFLNAGRVLKAGLVAAALAVTFVPQTVSAYPGSHWYQQHHKHRGVLFGRPSASYHWVRLGFGATCPYGWECFTRRSWWG
jgi:hypothetical protein